MLVTAEQAKLLKPKPTKVLIDAIAATNEAPAVVAPPAAGTNAVANATNVTAAATNAAPAKADAKAPAKAAAPAAKPAEKPAEQLPQAVIKMRELWERTYNCQASAIRIRHAIRQLEKKSREAEEYTAKTEENAKAIGKLSVAVLVSSSIFA